MILILQGPHGKVNALQMVGFTPQSTVPLISSRAKCFVHRNHMGTESTRSLQGSGPEFYDCYEWTSKGP